MPPFKAIPSLECMVIKKFGDSLANAMMRLEEENKQKSVASQYLVDAISELPVNLLESLVQHCTKTLCRSRTRTGLVTSLEILPGARVTILDLSHLFSGARLSRSLNTEVRRALQISLGRCSYLVRLALQSKCTNEILSVLGSSCPRLQELQISLSEQVTDEGLGHLVPKEDGDGGCSQLSTLDLLKCWNISPSGAETVLIGLLKLRRLMFSNMKSVLELLLVRVKSESSLTFKHLEYFDSSEYDLVTDLAITAPDISPACWMTGSVTIPKITEFFPNLATLKMLLTDIEVEKLVHLPRLTHLELELSDEPGEGLQHMLDNHPNIAKFFVLFLQVGPVQAAHLNSIARNCSSLNLFRIIGFHVESAQLLQSQPGHFSQLHQLHISLYDSSMESSSDEDEEFQGTRHPQEILDFFLIPAINIRVLNVHMNFSHFLNHSYLTNLILENNSLTFLERLNLSGPQDLSLGQESLGFLIDSLLSLSYINTSRWGNLSQLSLLKEKKRAKSNNWNLIVE